MKKYILVSLTLLLFAGVSKAQVIDVCGTDSIKLQVDNYQYGNI